MISFKISHSDVVIGIIHCCALIAYLIGEVSCSVDPVQYHKTSDVSHTLVGYEIVDYTNVVGAYPVETAPTTSSFST